MTPLSFIEDEVDIVDMNLDLIVGDDTRRRKSIEARPIKREIEIRRRILLLLMLCVGFVGMVTATCSMYVCRLGARRQEE